MIYLDNAATTFPKPNSVVAATNNALINFSANPGRSGHKLSIKASKEIYECRKIIAKLFNVKNIENIIFTNNCTQSLNTVIMGTLKPNDHVIISSLEHNSVVRPIVALSKERNITYSVAKVDLCDNEKTLSSFRKAITKDTRLAVFTHASNVCGVKLPVERIAAMLKQYGILTCVDAAQTAGVIPLNFEDGDIDYICAAGHKGLYGPMGTGILITNIGLKTKSLIYGGTGSRSSEKDQPNFMPDKFESGTLNLPGIAGLRAGAEFVYKLDMKSIHQKEIYLATKLYDQLRNIDSVELYTERPNEERFVALVLFNIKNKKSEEVARYLSKHSIAVRAGLHCAPLAHEQLGTIEHGGVRVAPGIFNNIQEINMLAQQIKQMV